MPSNTMMMMQFLRAGCRSFRSRNTVWVLLLYQLIRMLNCTVFSTDRRAIWGKLFNTGEGVAWAVNQLNEWHWWPRSRQRLIGWTQLIMITWLQWSRFRVRVTFLTSRHVTTLSLHVSNSRRCWHSYTLHSDMVTQWLVHSDSLK